MKPIVSPYPYRSLVDPSVTASARLRSLRSSAVRTVNSVLSAFHRSELEPPLHPHRRSEGIVDLVPDRSVVVTHVWNN